MTMLSDVASRAKDLRFFRDLAAQLLHLPDNDWTEWEWDWLVAMSIKSDSHEPSERERAKLAQIYSFSELFAGHDGLTVQAMVKICHRYHLDFLEDDSEFIEKLYRRNARTVRKRQLRRLVRLCSESGQSITMAWAHACTAEEPA